MSAPSPDSQGTPRKGRLSAKERLLAAADELFYAEGVHTVGIDRIIERAGVAKASLYSTYGSKDGLVRAYLQERHERRRALVLAGIERLTDPRARLLGVFDVLAELAARPGFRGCALYNASAESTGGDVIEEVTLTNRDWNRQLFTGLARDAGAADPAALAEQLLLLYDGATVGGRLDHSGAAARHARTVAEVLVDAAT